MFQLRDQICRSELPMMERLLLSYVMENRDEIILWLKSLDRTRVSDVGIRDQLLKLTKHTFTEIRARALVALRGAVNYPEVQARLRELTRDTDDKVSQTAIELLFGATHSPEVRGWLLALTRDADERVRQTAVQVLNGMTYYAEVRGWLLALTRDAEERVRQAAIELLRPSSHFEDVRARLFALTRDADERVRQSAVDALSGVVYFEEVREWLRTLTRDADERVRETALKALSRADEEDRKRAVARSRGAASPVVRAPLSELTPDTDEYDFTITFDPSLSAKQIRTSLAALADYYRACGGVGLRIDFELEEVLAAEPADAKR